MKTTPVKGCNDYLPQEAQLREYMQSSILSSYHAYGFQRIMTPALEESENLDKSDGGDNLNLIFKILKRGDKLTKALEVGSQEELSDLGLRYDLTLPLSRFYANNRQHLTLPFKCIQVDKVYRAERPQKGRLREFVQCDIDIIGSDSLFCEVELIDVTARALLQLGLKNFSVKINDRQILRDLLLQCGFLEKELSSVCITFDKLDKIGMEGIVAELREKNADTSAIFSLTAILEQMPLTLEDIKTFCGPSPHLDRISQIVKMVQTLAKGEYPIAFDPSLVRGQGYYTGSVFEIQSNDFNSSIAGGGRYDHLIGKFLGEDIPAVGFSIGFERIFSILRENHFAAPQEKPLIALLYEEDFASAATCAESLREEYRVSLLEKPKKLGKYLAALQSQGFQGVYLYGKSQSVELFAPQA